MDPLFALALAVLGCVTGVAAGLLGIGGGMILVPFLTILFTWQGLSLELTVHAAIATSMATILFTSVSSVRAHQKKGAVRWDLVAALTPGIGMVSERVAVEFTPERHASTHSRSLLPSPKP
jgi:uncharacterized membrane protein YfcA